MTMDPQTAALIAVIVALVKIIERLVDWGMAKLNPEQTRSMVVTLDPETARVIHDTHSKTSAVSDVTSLRDPDGVPMVYCLRSIPESLQQTASLLRDVSYSQQRLHDKLETLDGRVGDIQNSQRIQGRR